MLGRLWKPLMLALAFVAVTLSGCADDPAPEEEVDEAPEVEVTSDTGGIRGVVVDVSITPVVGATVTLTNLDMSVETDENGGFAFSKLEPGTYFIEATHPLYDTQQTSTDVVAGVPDPAPVKLQLERLIDAEPYLSKQFFKGFIFCSANIVGAKSEECGEGVGIDGFGRVGGNPDSDVQIDWTVDSDAAKTMVVEQVWEPTTELAAGSCPGCFDSRVSLDWSCLPVCGGNVLVEGAGPSPLLMRVDQEVLEAQEFDGETTFSTFTWAEDNPGLVLQQPFEQFVTTSYHLPLPAEWSLVAQSPDPF